MTDLVFTNGALVLEDRVEAADLVVRGGRIAEILPGGNRSANHATAVDCRGAYVFPGFVDLHAHLDDRIGAFCLADTWDTASRAAVVTGVTTVAAFATQSPRGADSVIRTVDEAMAKASGRSFCDFAFHYTPTRWDDGAWRALEILGARGHRTVKLYTTYAAAGLLAQDDIVTRVLNRAAALDLTILLHCEDDAVLADAASNPSIDWSDARAHALSRPAAAELRAVKRAVEACRETGGRLHVVHVSTPSAALEIRGAAASLPLTCETCPQYLALDDSMLDGENGYRWLCSPPLRDPSTRAEMLALARRGAFDVLSTDHCAFSRADKSTGAGSDIRTAPSGIAGIGALVPLGRELLLGDAPEAREVLRFARMLSENPARVLGLHPRKGALRVGSDADLVVARLDGAPSPIRSSLSDAFETYPNRNSRWRASAVYLRGELVSRDGALVSPSSPKGDPAWRT